MGGHSQAYWMATGTDCGAQSPSGIGGGCPGFFLVDAAPGEYKRLSMFDVCGLGD
jgi:hypothetical protein